MKSRNKEINMMQQAIYICPIWNELLELEIAYLHEHFVPFNNHENESLKIILSAKA